MASLQQQAEDIANQYLAEVSPDHSGQYSGIADPTTVGVLFRGFQSGLKVADCCEAAGISVRTYQRWCELAETQPTSAFAAFVTALKGAKAAGKLRRLEKIEKHGDKEWTALAWINERTDPEQFGKRTDDNSAPKVVVQIGVTQGDVQVSLQQPAFASQLSTVSHAVALPSPAVEAVSDRQD